MVKSGHQLRPHSSVDRALPSGGRGLRSSRSGGTKKDAFGHLFFDSGKRDRCGERSSPKQSRSDCQSPVGIPGGLEYEGQRFRVACFAN
jgi:hypothetical protein